MWGRRIFARAKPPPSGAWSVHCTAGAARESASSPSGRRALSLEEVGVGGGGTQDGSPQPLIARHPKRPARSPASRNLKLARKERLPPRLTFASSERLDSTDPFEATFIRLSRFLPRLLFMQLLDSVSPWASSRHR